MEKTRRVQEFVARRVRAFCMTPSKPNCGSGLVHSVSVAGIQERHWTSIRAQVLPARSLWLPLATDRSLSFNDLRRMMQKAVTRRAKMRSLTEFIPVAHSD